MTTLLKRKNALLIIGIVTGIAYGLLIRLVFGEEATLASITFLFVIPAILGTVPLMFTNDEQLKSYKNIIFIPWLTVGAFFVTMILLGIEDVICLFILALPFFMLATAGAFVYRLVQIHRQKRKGKLLTLLLIPFLLSPLEERFESPSDIYSVESSVVISSTTDVVWKNIVEVPEISREEFNEGFFNTIGIPRPLRASVNSKALGGERTGNFEGGLRFRETITAYYEPREIAFSITVDPASIRGRVFDQHVLKGRYFSFVEARYSLDELPGGHVRLTLSSRYRLKSNVNFYGKFWGDIILKDFQDRLLDVIRNRCQGGSFKF